MRKRLVDSYTDPATSITYGLRGSPVDFSLSQQYTHDHVNAAVRDFLMKGAGTAVVEGFDYALAGALSLSIAAGRAYDAAGIFYETITTPPGGPSVVTLEAADPANPRIDLVYVQLEAGVQAVPLTRTFRRLLTEAEVLAGHAPYPPQPIERFAEEHAKATVRVRKGTPGAVPVAPALGASEAPLFHVRVNAGAATLVSGNVTDVRNKTRSLSAALALIDAINASPALANLNESIDDRVAVLIADSVSLTRAYDDAGNLLTLDVDTAWMDERVDDRVNALVSPGSGISKSYNDAGNLLTLALDLVFLDTRYVNAAGDTMPGALKIDIGGGTDPYGGNNAGLHVAMNGGAGTSPIAVYGYGQAGIGPNDVAYGGFFTAHANRALSGVNTTSYGVYAETLGGHNRWAGYFNGNVHVAGVLTKASGTFRIDHPTNPYGKDLIHSFLEANRNGLIYWFEVELADGSAVVSLDDVLGFTPGTARQLMQNVFVMSVRHPDGMHVSDLVEEWSNLYRITLTSADVGDAATVRLLVVAERADAVMKLSPFVDEDGLLIPEHDKPALTADDLLMMRPVSEGVPESHPLLGQARENVLPQLIGKEGYMWQWETQGAAVAVRPVQFKCYVPQGLTALDPAGAGTAANDASAGTQPWTGPLGGPLSNHLAAEDGNVALASISPIPNPSFSEVTNYLTATNLGLVVPEGVTVRAVMVEIKRRMAEGVGLASIVDHRVSLVSGGVVRAANKAHTESEWQVKYVHAGYVFTGADLDGLTAADYEAPGFGVAFAASLHHEDPEEVPVTKAQVEVVRVTLYYELPAGMTSVTAPAGVGANDAGAGVRSWTDVSNVSAADGAEASLSTTFAGEEDDTQYLVGTVGGGGLDVPEGATINGVEVVVKRRNITASDSSLRDAEVRLVVGGEVAGDDRAAAGVYWPGTATTRTYGGMTDLWGLSLTVADVNAPDFGAALRAYCEAGTGQPRVDAITIKVYYTT